MSEHVNAEKGGVNGQEYVDVKGMLKVDFVLGWNVVHEIDLLGSLDDILQSQLSL